MAALTDAEAAVYDRQIRVWGVETQKRLNGAKVLIVGCNGLAAEVAKNVVLAGVGSVTVVDDTPCSAASPASFLIPADADGTQSAAAASAEALQEMNPLVQVTSAPGSTAIPPEPSALEQYHVAFLAGASLAQLQRWDDACATAGVPFFGAMSRGTAAFLFADLLEHTCATEITTSTQAQVRKGSAVTTAKSVLSYARLRQALSGSSAGMHPKRTHKLAFVLKVIASWEGEHGQLGSVEQLAAIEQEGQRLLAAEGLSHSLFEPQSLRQWLDGAAVELPPVNAVLGGLASNELLTAVTGRGEPMFNFVFYSLTDGAARVERLV